MTGYLQIKLNALLVLLASSIQKAKTNDTVICQEEKNGKKCFAFCYHSM